MTRFTACVMTALALAVLALACGRYGPPQRAEKPRPAPEAAQETVPITDPAVSR
jgi:hypothetical protein